MEILRLPPPHFRGGSRLCRTLALIRISSKHCSAVLNMSNLKMEPSGSSGLLFMLTLVLLLYFLDVFTDGRTLGVRFPSHFRSK